MQAGGERRLCFAMGAHKLWISLPPRIKHSSSTDTCKNNLKAPLFSKPFCCSWWCSYFNILDLFPFRKTSCKLFSISHLLILQVLLVFCTYLCCCLFDNMYMPSVNSGCFKTCLMNTFALRSST